eukprot:jgi/Ulvmu1/12676/UM094_0033.1
MYSNPTFDSDSLFGSPVGSSVNDADLFAGRYTMVSMEESLELRKSADKPPSTQLNKTTLSSADFCGEKAGLKLADDRLNRGESPLRRSQSRLSGSENVQPAIPLDVSIHPSLVDVIDIKHLMSPDAATTRLDHLPTASSIPQQTSIPIAAVREEMMYDEGASKGEGASLPSPAETKASAAASAMQSPLMDRFLDAARPELNLNPDTYLSECSRDDCLTPSRHPVSSPSRSLRRIPSAPALPSSTPPSPGAYPSGASLSLAQSVSFARDTSGVPISPTATHCTGEPCSPPDLAPPAPSASPGDTRSSPSQLLGPTHPFGGLPGVLRPSYLPPPVAPHHRRPTASAPSSFASSPGMTCAPSEWTLDATAALAVITDSASEQPDSRPTSGSPTLQPPAWAAPGVPASPDPKPLRQLYAEASALTAAHAAACITTTPPSPGLISDRELDSLDLGGQDSYFTLGGGSSSVFSAGRATAAAAMAGVLDRDDGTEPASLRARYGGGAAGRDIKPLEMPADGTLSDDDGSHVSPLSEEALRRHDAAIPDCAAPRRRAVVPSFGATGPTSTLTSPKVSPCSTPRDAPAAAPPPPPAAPPVPPRGTPPPPADHSDVTPRPSTADSTESGTPLTPCSFAASTPEDRSMHVVPVVLASPSCGPLSASTSVSSPGTLPEASGATVRVAGAGVPRLPHAPAQAAPPAAAAPTAVVAVDDAVGPEAVTFTPRDLLPPAPAPVPAAAAVAAAPSAPEPSPMALAAKFAASRAAARAAQPPSALLISPESDMESISKPGAATSASEVEGTAESAPAAADDDGDIVFMDMEGESAAAEASEAAADDDGDIAFMEMAGESAAAEASEAAAEAEAAPHPPPPPADDDVMPVVQFRSTPLRPIPEDQSVAHGLGSSMFGSSDDASDGASTALRGVYDSTSPPEPLDLIGAAAHDSSDEEEWTLSTSGAASEESPAAVSGGSGGVTPPPLSAAEAAAKAALLASVESLSQRVSGWWSYNGSETPVETDESPSVARAALSPERWSGAPSASPAAERPLFSPAGSAGGLDVGPWVETVEMADAESAGSAPTPGDDDNDVFEAGMGVADDGREADNAESTALLSVPGSADVSASPAAPGSTEDLDDYSGGVSMHSTRSARSLGEVSDAASSVGLYAGVRLEGVGFSAADLEESAALRTALVSGGSIGSGGVPAAAPSPLLVPHAGLGAEASDPEMDLGSPLSAPGSPVAWGVRGEVSAPVSARLLTPAGLEHPDEPAESDGAAGREKEDRSVAGECGGGAMDVPSPPLRPQRSAVSGMMPTLSPEPQALLDPSADLPQMQRSPGAVPVAVALALTRRLPQAPMMSRDGPVLGGAAAAGGIAAALPAEVAVAVPADEAFAPSPLPQTGSYCTAYRETWDIAMSSYGEALQERAERLERKQGRAALREAGGRAADAPQSTPASSSITPSLVGGTASSATTARLLATTGLGLSSGSSAARRSSWGGTPAAPAPRSLHSSADARRMSVESGAARSLAHSVDRSAQRSGTPEPAQAQDALVRESSRHVWSADKSSRLSIDSRRSAEIVAAPASMPQPARRQEAPWQQMPVHSQEPVRQAMPLQEAAPVPEAAPRQGKIARMKAKVKSGFKGLFKKNKNKA